MHRRRRREQAEASGDPFERRALHDHRDDDDEEDGVEDRVRVRHVRGEHERREHDRDRAAQPRPAEQQPGRPGRELGEERSTPRTAAGRTTSISTKRQREARKRHVDQVAREDEQAEHDEDRDLREEGEALVEGDELAAVARRRAADGEPDEVDREEAAAADHVRGAERERAGGDRGDRREGADRVGEPPEDPDRKRRRARRRRAARGRSAATIRSVRSSNPYESGRSIHAIRPSVSAMPGRVVAARLRLERAGQRAPDVRRAQAWRRPRPRRWRRRPRRAGPTRAT